MFLLSSLSNPLRGLRDALELGEMFGPEDDADFDLLPELRAVRIVVESLQTILTSPLDSARVAQLRQCLRALDLSALEAVMAKGEETEGLAYYWLAIEGALHRYVSMPMTQAELMARDSEGDEANHAGRWDSYYGFPTPEEREDVSRRLLEAGTDIEAQAMVADELSDRVEAGDILEWIPPGSRYLEDDDDATVQDEQED